MQGFSCVWEQTLEVRKNCRLVENEKSPASFHWLPSSWKTNAQSALVYLDLPLQSLKQKLLCCCSVTGVFPACSASLYSPSCTVSARVSVQFLETHIPRLFLRLSR